jgi:hypothetical protein
MAVDEAGLRGVVKAYFPDLNEEDHEVCFQATKNILELSQRPLMDLLPTPEELQEKSPMATHADIDNWFTYHPPTQAQQVRYVTLREQFKLVATLIIDCTPACPDQTAALRMLRETSMAVNQTIACNENDAEVPRPKAVATLTEAEESGSHP